MTRYLKPNAVCVINCSWDESELEAQLPAKMRKDLAAKQAGRPLHPNFPCGMVTPMMPGQALHHRCHEDCSEGSGWEHNRKPFAGCFLMHRCWHRSSW